MKHIIDDKDLLEWFKDKGQRASTFSPKELVNDFLEDKPKAYQISIEHKYTTDLMLKDRSSIYQLEYLVKHKLVEELTEEIFNKIPISRFTDPQKQELIFCINLDIIEKEVTK